MLNIINGKPRQSFAAPQLRQVLQENIRAGLLYFGFPVLRTADSEHSVIDSLLITEDVGALAFHFVSVAQSLEEVQKEQDRLFIALEGKLKNVPELRKGRDLGPHLEVVAFVHGSLTPWANCAAKVCNVDTLPEVLAQFSEPQRNRSYYPRLVAAIQTVTNLVAKRKRDVKVPGSMGSKLSIIEAAIANLDEHQNRAAVETPDGPQRIRGIAGSGKTIVLALKAALLHAARPDWKICIVFQTRTLYQQFEDLIKRFCIDKMGEEPDPEKLQILHAWGGADAGFYSLIAKAWSRQPMTFGEARSKYTAETAFEGACNELLQDLGGIEPTPIYDAILIDEAQDLPRPFFELAWLATKDPKRIVWAYDELQNLSSFQMVSPSELFGNKPGTTEPRVVSLRDQEHQPKQDIILPTCYRTAPWILVTAHALGFGVYRAGTLVQWFGDSGLWSAIGYQVEEGDLSPGSRVVLARRPEATPDHFFTVLSADEAVQLRAFNDVESLALSVAQDIHRVVTEQELQLQDILVVYINATTVLKDAEPLKRCLRSFKIDSHIAGLNSSKELIFKSNSLAISSIFRAKGNEAALVYVMDAHYGVAGLELQKRRNSLFTAITRAKAWVRIAGVGLYAELLKAEYEKVREAGFKLALTIPPPGELEKIKQIHKDMTSDERKEWDFIQRAVGMLDQKLVKGDVDFATMPESVRELFEKYLDSKNNES